MNAPAQQNRGHGNLPVFKSDRLENSPNALALWGNFEPTGAHVKGTLTQVSSSGEQYSTNVTGFFKINEKGGVQIQLSSRQASGYAPEGTLYVQSNGELVLYPKDKNQPKLTVRATNAMSPEVADAIGVKRAEPRQTYNQGRAEAPQAQHQQPPQSPPAAPAAAPVRQEAQAPRPQAPAPATRVAQPPQEEADAWDPPTAPPVQSGGRPRF
jgi:hypothetical protein